MRPLVLLLVLSLAGPRLGLGLGHASPRRPVDRRASDAKAASRDAYAEGVRLYEIGDFRLALESFKRAYLLYQDAALLFNIAQCHRALGEKAEAARAYRQVLRKAPLSAAMRAEVTKVVHELEDAVANEARPSPEPPRPAEASPAPRASALELARARAAREEAEPVSAVQAAAPGRGLRIAGATLLAVGLAALAGGAVCVGLAAQANGEIVKDGRFDPAAEDRRDALQIADVSLFAAGGAVAVTGLTALLIGRRAQTRASVAVVPSLAVGGVGLVVAGTF